MDVTGPTVADANFDAQLVELVPTLTRFAAVLCRRQEREDLLQETMARVWARRDQFDQDRGELSTWAMAIMFDQARRGWRATRRRFVLHDAGSVPPPDVGGIDIRAAVARLPRQQRAAVVLFYYVDIPVADIAAVLGRSVGTVKSNLSDARVRLAKELADRG